MKAASFQGGLRFAVFEQRDPATIKTLPLPSRVVLPLSLHRDQACDLLVKKGTTVTEGQIIGQGVSSALLAPISGTIEEINKDFKMPSGESATAVRIQTPEEEAPGRSSPDFEKMGTLEKLIKTGVSDLGKQRGPLLNTLASLRTQKIETLIINCLDEYFVQGRNSSLLTQHTRDFLDGVNILQEISGAGSAILVVYTDAGQPLEALHSANNPFPLVRVQAKHPQHTEPLLVQVVSNQEYPAEKSPEDLGITILSAETAYCTARAIRHNQPILDKLVSVAGCRLEQPVNCFVRIGTTIREVLEQLGLDPDSLGKVILGGPLSGQSISQLETPVTQETDLIFLQEIQEVYRVAQDAVCFKCGYCVDVCPMRLMPFLISGFSEGKNFELAEKNDIFTCIECGCCAHVCPVHLPMVQWIQLGKSALRAQRR